MSRIRVALLFGVAAALAVAARQPGGERPVSAAPAADSQTVTFRCPADGHEVATGATLQSVVDTAAPGSVLCMSAGSYRGPVEIRTRVSLEGPSTAIIRGDGGGTTIRVLADSVILGGFTVEGSGRRYDRMDAAVYVRGRGIVVAGLTVRDALFGIIAERSEGLTIVNNHVLGLATLPVGIRGDGIRLWEVRHSVVTSNHLEDSRDILVWYSPGNRIAGNTVERSRYATHFMYSDDCVVEDGAYHDNVVGIFVMYSNGITLRDNLIAGNAAANGMGLGVKESGNLRVERNRFVRDGRCLYLDTSPFRAGDSVLVRGNVFAGCAAGVTFHSSERRNTFLDNVFVANRTPVAVEGRGNAREVVWSANYFDEYRGYDLDGDGTGDVPFELRSLSASLVASHPRLAFFRGTVVFALLDIAGRFFPLLEPETLLTDPRPRMVPPGPA